MHVTIDLRFSSHVCCQCLSRFNSHKFIISMVIVFVASVKIVRLSYKACICIMNGISLFDRVVHTSSRQIWHIYDGVVAVVSSRESHCHRVVLQNFRVFILFAHVWLTVSIVLVKQSELALVTFAMKTVLGYAQRFDVRRYVVPAPRSRALGLMAAIIINFQSPSARLVFFMEHHELWTREAVPSPRSTQR